MKKIETMEKSTKEAIVKGAVDIFYKDPENNIDKIFDIIRKYVKDPDNLKRVNNVYQYYNEYPSVNRYIKNFLTKTDKKCLEKFFTNFLANATWYGMPKRAKLFQEQGIKTPYVILISPSMRCNLRCTGCYAANYSREDDIPIEEVDRIIGEARDIGIYFFVILGGEPFFVKDMLKIYEKYDDCIFAPFTNGTLFDEELADKVKDLGNVVPMFSLEGFEEETDKRRGKGIFNKVMHGMDLLHERGVLFGVSSATGRYNMDAVSSEKFIDMIIEKGAKMIWYFIFMPVGDDPDVNLMLTPEQRLELGSRVRNIRKTKEIFPIDFFNDAPYVGGCIAGKYFCHINSHEDVEPCIFAHFSIDNVKNKPLLDCFKGPFFKELISRQPYTENMLRPCMMIDNPEVIREVAAKVNPKPSDKGADMMIHDKKFQAQLDKVAADFKPYADKAWKEVFHEKGNSKMSKG